MLHFVTGHVWKKLSRVHRTDWKSSFNLTIVVIVFCISWHHFIPRLVIPGIRNSIANNRLPGVILISFRTTVALIDLLHAARGLVTGGTCPPSWNRERWDWSAMVNHCCVPFCHSKSSREKELSFHRFPKCESKKKKWKVKIRRDEGELFTITEHTRVCSLHLRVMITLTTLGGLKVFHINQQKDTLGLKYCC